MADSHRVFFALWPDQQVRHALSGMARSRVPKQARPVPPENLHMTLLFLGRQPAHRLADVIDAANSCEHYGDITLTVDRLQYWNDSRVLCACLTRIPPELLDIHQCLRDAMLQPGLQPDRRVYRPHVTLARGVGQAPASMAVDPLVWQVRDFVLLESMQGEQGVRYRQLQQWPLA